MRSPDIRNLGVGKVDLKRAEPYRRVGANGQVKFSHGGEGDCIWSNAPTGPDKFPYEPVSFYKDPYGVVHLVGVTISVAGGGGDGACSAEAGAESIEDRVAVQAARPHIDPLVSRSSTTPPADADAFVAVVGINGLDLSGSGGGVVPAGSVLNDAGTNPGSLVFDGDNFRAAGKKVGLPRKPRPVLGRGALRRLLGLGG